jgi:hypothetical protein
VSRRDDVLAWIKRLREEGRASRGDEGVPAGGWPPSYDDEGNPIPSPPPEQPTDVPKEVADRVRPAEEDDG